MRLLIVEDDPDLLRVLVDILTLEGALPVAASLGAVALELLSAFTFALVLLDLNLPDMDGWQILKSVQALQPAPPVIILTANEADSVRQQALAAGATDYVVKPVSARSLVALVKRHLAEPL